MKGINILFAVAIIAVAVALLNLIFVINRVGEMKLTGYGGMVGQANLSVESMIDLNFTTFLINWSWGRVNIGRTFANLTSTGVVDGGNWSIASNGLVLQNDGNINVSLSIASGKTPAGFLGGTNPVYQWNITNADTNPACQNASGINLSQEFFNSSTSAINICTNFSFIDDRDAIRIDVKLLVPYDSIKGVLTDTITATATAT